MRSAESADALGEVAGHHACRVRCGSVSALAAGAFVGPYRLKREIGSGGMADLWLAERADGAFERDVALKLPRITRLRQDLAARFAHERDILARLEHPYIARFYDAGVTDDGLPFLAMEYRRWPADHAVVRRAHAGRGRAAAALDQVLEAVQFAHSNLIIHRDLKPSNILVTESGQVRLLDFGIAKLLAEGNVAQETPLTQLSGRALTPEYASPEQIRGEALTTASDVYSLARRAVRAAHREDAVSAHDHLRRAARAGDRRRCSVAPECRGHRGACAVLRSERKAAEARARG